MIPVDRAENPGRRKQLSRLLFSSEGRPHIRFTVVSEPTSEGGDCVDIGYAEADLFVMSRGGGDLSEVALDVVSEEEEGPIGVLTVSVIGKEVVKALKKK